MMVDLKLEILKFTRAMVILNFIVTPICRRTMTASNDL